MPYRRHNRVLIGKKLRNLGGHNLLVTKKASVNDKPRILNPVASVENGPVTTFGITTTWQLPSDTDITITGYEMEYEQIAAPVTAWTGTQLVPNLTGTFTGLPEGVYRVRVRTLHAGGPSDWVTSSNINAFINISFNWNGQPSFHTLAA